MERLTGVVGCLLLIVVGTAIGRTTLFDRPGSYGPQPSSTVLFDEASAAETDLQELCGVLEEVARMYARRADPRDIHLVELKLQMKRASIFGPIYSAETRQRALKQGAEKLAAAERRLAQAKRAAADLQAGVMEIEKSLQDLQGR